MSVKTYDSLGRLITKASAGNKGWENQMSDAIMSFYGCCVAQGFAPETVIDAMAEFVNERDNVHSSNKGSTADGEVHALP